MLHVQLFDLDLKLKFALRQSTVGLIIATAFFAGSELLEGVIPVQGTVLGLISAGMIVILLRPVQGFVYRAALEGAFADGRASERERSILDRLCEELSIAPELAQRLESEATTREAHT